MDKLEMVCEELVAIPTGIKMFQHILFKPNPATIDSLRAAAKMDEYYTLSIKDAGGDSTSRGMHRVITVNLIRKVLMVTTKEL